VPLRLQGGAASDRERVARFESAIRFLTRVESPEWTEGDATGCAVGVVGTLSLLVPLEGLVDLAAERARLDKELRRIEAEIAKCQAKLASGTFVANAPAAVVEQERKRLAEWSAQQAALTAQRQPL
jgi:valyl-tRNA synthetase